jgi:polyisoprenoid-binding protein YceI
VSSNGWSAEAEVPAGQMNTASEGRDRNMHKMLNTNSHPYLRGSVTNAPIPGVNGTNITLHLNISGKPVALPVQVTGWTESAGRIQFHAAWSVSLKQYGLKPPSVMGVIRVGDAVSLEADVTVDKTKSASEPSVIKQ